VPATRWSCPRALARPGGRCHLARFVVRQFPRWLIHPDLPGAAARPELVATRPSHTVGARGVCRARRPLGRRGVVHRSRGSEWMIRGAHHPTRRVRGPLGHHPSTARSRRAENRGAPATERHRCGRRQCAPGSSGGPRLIAEGLNIHRLRRGSPQARSSTRPPSGHADSGGDSRLLSQAAALQEPRSVSSSQVRPETAAQAVKHAVSWRLLDTGIEPSPCSRGR
jgi:hypothetical protein